MFSLTKFPQFMELPQSYLCCIILQCHNRLPGIHKIKLLKDVRCTFAVYLK